jgi:hypothetical protein
MSFIHGAFLPDPDGLLEGSGKAMRHIPIDSLNKTRREAIRKLIRAAIDYSPAAGDDQL